MSRHTRIGRSHWLHQIGDFLLANKRTGAGAKRAEKNALPRVLAAREAMPALACGLLDRRQIRLRRD